MNTPLLARDTVDAVKGVLILAVIVGHSEAVAFHFPWLRRSLYYFHVQCFFLLSSVLDTKPLTIELLRDRSVRYLTPYFAFLGGSWIVHEFFRPDADGRFHALQLLGAAIFIGNEPEIYRAVGMRFLWFLPALFSLVMLKAAASRWALFRNCLIATSVVWIAAAAYVIPWMRCNMPYGIAIALFFYGLGECVRCNLEAASPTIRERAGWVGVAATVVLTALICFGHLGWVAASNITTYDIRLPLTWIVGLVYPCAVFLGLVCILDATKMPWLAFVGRYSLPMYLIHMFIYRGLTFACFGRRFSELAVVGPHLGVGLVILFVTVIASLCGSYLIWRCPRLRMAVFPNTWAESPFAAVTTFAKLRA